MLLHDGEVIAEWVENGAIQSHFAPYAEAFTVVEDEVELPITRKDVQTLINDIEGFLAGIADFGRIADFLTACAVGESKFSYREALAI